MIIIEGITASGRKFRPSAWAEMLIEGVGLAHFGSDHKIHYLPYVEPATINGNAAILMDEELEKIRPEAYKEILHPYPPAATAGRESTSTSLYPALRELLDRHEH